MKEKNIPLGRENDKRENTYIWRRTYKLFDVRWCWWVQFITVDKHKNTRTGRRVRCGCIERINFRYIILQFVSFSDDGWICKYLSPLDCYHFLLFFFRGTHIIFRGKIVSVSFEPRNFNPLPPLKGHRVHRVHALQNVETVKPLLHTYHLYQWWRDLICVRYCLHFNS